MGGQGKPVIERKAACIDLAIHLIHHRQLEQARRLQLAVGVDVGELARVEVLDRHAKAPTQAAQLGGDERL